MSIRGTLILTSVVAVLCLSFRHAPVTIMSILLLTPFPIVLFCHRLIRRRFIKSRRAFAFTCIFTAASFYVGFYCGPLTAFLADHHGWGIPRTRMYVLKHFYKPLGTPIVMAMDHAPKWSTTPLQQYTRVWGALGEEEERMYPGK